MSSFVDCADCAFLVQLTDAYGGDSGGSGRRSGGGESLFLHMKNVIGETFGLEDATLGDVLEITNDKVGGLQGWFDGKCRTKVVKL